MAGLLLLLACAPLLAGPAFGAPSYTILFGNGTEYQATQSTPFQHADEFPVSLNGPGTSTFTGHAFTYPGHVGFVNHLETHWTGSACSSRHDVDSRATATDFIITGPSGPWVEGALHLRVRANLVHVGGATNHSSHGARVNVDVRARNGALIAMGDLTSSNHDTHGSGLLAGLTNPELDFAFTLSGFYPVGTPFDVVIRILGVETTYGTGASTPNPGYVLADAGSNSSYGLFLEEVSGQVMTLPEGYTLNSASWGIADNQFTDVLGVGPAPRGDAMQLSAYPNPFTASSSVTFDQPRASHVRLQVFDVSGRLIRTLANEWRAEGTQRFQWDGRSDRGNDAGSGIYFLRVEAGGRAASRRVVRMNAGR